MNSLIRKLNMFLVVLFFGEGGGVNKNASICNKCVFRFTDLDCNDTVSELLVPATEPLPLIV